MVFLGTNLGWDFHSIKLSFSFHSESAPTVLCHWRLHPLPGGSPKEALQVANRLRVDFYLTKGRYLLPREIYDWLWRTCTFQSYSAISGLIGEFQLLHSIVIVLLIQAVALVDQLWLWKSLGRLVYSVFWEWRQNCVGGLVVIVRDKWWSFLLGQKTCLASFHLFYAFSSNSAALFSK